MIGSRWSMSPWAVVRYGSMIGRTDDGQMPFDDGSMSRSTVDHHVACGGIYIYICLGWKKVKKKKKTDNNWNIFEMYYYCYYFFVFMSTGRDWKRNGNGDLISIFSSNIVENGLNLIWNDALYLKMCIGKISDDCECPIRGRITRNGWPDPGQPKPGYDGDDRRRMVIGGEKFVGLDINSPRPSIGHSRR